MATRSDQEAQQIRAIVKATDHDDARLIQHALHAYGAMLRAVDNDFPNPDQRARANKADALAARFQSANTARDFLEERATA